MNSLGPLFRRLSAMLPPMLAEDEVIQHVSRGELAGGLSQLASLPQAEAVLAVVERLFCSLALLHAASLAQGQWRFNSYPAWLVARSMLETLSTDHHPLLDPGYWSQQPAENDMEEQRALLKRLENGRVGYHPNNNAQPIRFVYVAWAVIQVDGRFLLYAREDKMRADARGHFGFPGGRFKLSDTPLAERLPQAEHDFAYGIGHWPMAHLQRALYRELREELELSERDHYTLAPAIDVAPYRSIEGARNHHSYTEYRIRLFPLQLNLHGKLKLFDRLHRCRDLFAWFTADELERESNAAGQQAFVTALVEHFGPGLKELVAVPPATTESYLFNDALIGIDIPLTPERPITSGRSGKSMTTYAAGLTVAELQWLWALAWHAKSLPITETSKMGLLHSGWMRVDDMTVVRSLRDKLDAKGLVVVEIQGGRYTRLSIHPRMVYFDPEFFRYRLHGNAIKGRLELHSIEMNSPLGMLRLEPSFFELNTTLAGELRHLDGVQRLSDSAPNPPSLRRILDDLMSDETKRIGLRKMITHIDKDRKYRELVIRRSNDD